MLITIGAMIGAGKTSLAELVANHFNSEVFYESVEELKYAMNGKIQKMDL